MTLVSARPGKHGITVDGPELLPLDAGEQYRFSFEMDACIGCHSCEVACSEQNGNPSGVEWRKVGEVEAGTFPDTRRASISMACNHCLEPACLQGCPTNAYVKLANGVVAHHADDCIGCQYCIWNCPYDVPVYNPERRIVTKCDLCQPRLAAGRAPACVQACPTGAIKVEKVDVGAWRAAHADADAPGLPPSGITISTTRVVPPRDMPSAVMVAGHDRMEAEDPHLPLVALTVLSQAAVGTVWACLLLRVGAALTGASVPGRLATAAWLACLCAAAALGASLLHLGRPAMAWKALRNLRTSWLSREVALLGAFTMASVAAAVTATVGPATGICTGVSAVAAGLGAAGLYASGRLYLIPARPLWNSRRTIVGFFATALALGPLITLVAAGSGISMAWVRALFVLAAAGAGLALAAWRDHVHAATGSSAREFRLGALLLHFPFGSLTQARVAFGGGAVVLLLISTVTARSEVIGAASLGLACVAAGELVGRYLFYVTVVPMRGPGRFASRRP